MANIKISQLTAAAAALGTQEFEVNDSGASKKVTGTQIAAFVEAEVSSNPSFTGDVTIADKIVHSGDTNTAIRFPSADTVTVETSGAERLRVTSTGNVGIGTTAPSEKLSVTNNISATNLYVTSNGDTSTNGISGGFKHGGLSSKSLVIEADPNNVGAATYMGFNVDGTERGRFDASGNLKFNSGYGSVATAYGCRAWVNFNGTGTVAIRASGNVTSITDNGPGLYTVNFTTAMPDANYAVSVTSGDSNKVGGGYSSVTAPTTTAVAVQSFNDTFSASDSAWMSVAITR